MNSKVNIKIDGQKYHVSESMIGSELKDLANIPLEVRLVIKIDNEPDLDVENSQVYELTDGMRLVSDTFDDIIKIMIDNKHYIVYEIMTGAELLAVVNASPEEYKLVKEEKVEADKEYLPDVKYEICKNDVFFTTLRKVTNGGR